MRRPRFPRRFRLRAVALALALLVVIAPSILSSPASAQEPPEPDLAADVAAAFDALRSAIQAEPNLPDGLERAFVAKVDAAEVALLLPAVQDAPDCGNKCRPSVHILDALSHQNTIASRQHGYNPATIEAEIQELIDLIERLVQSDPDRPIVTDSPPNPD